MPLFGRTFLVIQLSYIYPVLAFPESRNQHRPTEYIQVLGHTFEQQVSSLAHNVFAPLGLTVERWTRMPYLCEGDLEHSFYKLDDAVFLLKAS